MSEKIWLAELTAEQLTRWLIPPRAEMPFAILERIDRIDFPAGGETIDPVVWAQGRVFGATRELRWERRGAVFQIRVISEQEPGEPFVVQGEFSKVQVRDSWCYMWGVAEGRIGRRLEYRAMPPGQGRPCLLRRELWQGAKLVATRLTGMKMEDEK
jgi:hypothetical protein